jgi:ribose transport system permease protein
VSSGSSVAGIAAEQLWAILVRWLMRFAPPLLIVAMEIGFWTVQPGVLSPGNLVNILEQSTYLIVFAAGQMIVILTRGFDLSLGATVSAVSVASALVMTSLADAGYSVVLAVAAGIAAGMMLGLLIGLFNGTFVSRLNVNPFVVTLGSLNIATGIATTISGGRPVFNVPDEFSSILYTGKVFVVPVPVVLAAVVCLLLFFLLERTVFGRSLYLIGNNPRAADLAGLPRVKYLTLAYVLCSALAAFGALMLTGRTGSGEPNLGGSLMLESIAAAVIGGVSLQGGIGGVAQVILGSVFVTMLANGMDLLQVGGYIQSIILGGVIIAAVFLDRLRSTRV